MKLLKLLKYLHFMGAIILCVCACVTPQTIRLLRCSSNSPIYRGGGARGWTHNTALGCNHRDNQWVWRIQHCHNLLGHLTQLELSILTWENTQTTKIPLLASTLLSNRHVWLGRLSIEMTCSLLAWNNYTSNISMGYTGIKAKWWKCNYFRLEVNK